MTQPTWEEIQVPRGAYVGWGNHPGQHVTGKVLAFAEKGGTDFNDEPCPSLEIELTEPAASFDKNGTRTDYQPGEMVSLNCGQVSLKRAVRAAAVDPGDLIKLTLTGLEPGNKGTVKVFGVKVARGAGRAMGQAPATQPQAAPSFGGAPYREPTPAPAYGGHPTPPAEAYRPPSQAAPFDTGDTPPF